MLISKSDAAVLLLSCHPGFTTIRGQNVDRRNVSIDKHTYKKDKRSSIFLGPILNYYTGRALHHNFISLCYASISSVFLAHPWFILIGSSMVHQWVFFGHPGAILIHPLYRGIFWLRKEPKKCSCCVSVSQSVHLSVPIML